MKLGTAAALAIGFLGIGLAERAEAIVIGNVNTKDADYRALGMTYTSVGQIQGFDASGQYAASGVLITSPDSQWVLTAAHVTSGATAINFFLDGGGDFASFSTRSGIAADQIYTHPNWTGGLSGGFDIGLVHLGSVANCITVGACATSDLATAAPSLGSGITAVGYGKTGTGKRGATIFDGKKRGGTNIFDGFYNNGLQNILLGDFDSGSRGDNWTGTTARTAMESMIASGDSGGGLFDASGMLIGITSFIWGLDGRANSDFGDVGGWSSVASAYTWITDCVVFGIGCGTNSATSLSSSLTGAGMRAALVRTPEPGLVMLLAVGFGLGGLVRTRRARAA